ncbi:MAG: beta-lactamase family protein [Verrucomicrobia bacterium]|nr:beta-lactamase family protein [Verrucomicrobiota bacterium]
MNRTIRLCCAFALGVGILAALGSETDVPPEFADVRKLIRQEIAEGGAPSIAVAVVKNDRLVWAEGFGYADLEARRPATADSIYLLASVSKPITATGLMVLADRGKIDLDKAANDYLPGPKIRANRGSEREITLRRLANHTSGMQVHYNFYYDDVPPLSHDEVIRRYGIAHTEPGSRVEYCNLAFGILDYITEIVSEMPWREFMEQTVYDPTGMSHTSDRIRPGLEGQGTVQYQFDLSGKLIRVPPYRFDHNGASAIWSSARDLSRFLRLHLNGGIVEERRLLKEETARSMQKVTAAPDPKKTDAGFGIAWAVGSVLGHAFFEHTGGMPGVATRVRGFVNDKAGFVILINASGGDLLGKVTDGLTRAVLPDWREEPRKTVTKEPARENPDPFLGEWKGALEHWDGAIPMVLTVAGASAVTAKFGQRPPAQLREVSFANQILKGQTRGLLRTQEGFHGPVTIEFALSRAGEELVGIGVAKAEGYFALCHGVRLMKVPSEGIGKPKN